MIRNTLTIGFVVPGDWRLRFHLLCPELEPKGKQAVAFGTALKALDPHGQSRAVPPIRPQCHFGLEQMCSHLRKTTGHLWRMEAKHGRA